MKRFVVACWQILKKTIDYWLEGKAFTCAGALAFFTLFSLAPLVIIAVTVVGFVWGEAEASSQIGHVLHEYLGERAAEAIQQAVQSSQVKHSGWMPTLIGIGMMVFGATTVFAQLQLSLNTIWGVVPRPSRSSALIFIRNRLLSLLVVLAISLLAQLQLLLSIMLAAMIALAREWISVPAWVVMGADYTLSFILMTIFFCVIFRVLPDVILRWRDVLYGALLTSVLSMIGRFGIAFYLSHTATASTYGAAGSLVMILLWVNYSSLILLFGAAFIRAQAEVRGNRIVARNSAVFVHYRMVDEVVVADGVEPS